MHVSVRLGPKPPRTLMSARHRFAAVSLSLVIDLLAESQMIPSKNPKSNHLRMTVREPQTHAAGQPPVQHIYSWS